MRTKTATVWEDGATGTATLAGGPAVNLDTPAWFSWLDAPTTRSFAYPIYNAQQGYIEAFMTLRKEQRQRGSAYLDGLLARGRTPAQSLRGPLASGDSGAAAHPRGGLLRAHPGRGAAFGAAPTDTGRVRRAKMDTREDTDNVTPSCC